ncbi:energy-coupling factor ABC transporter ATP-binding protein [Gloeobacter violaceus]|uniref:Putative ABC transporter ATP-binding protein gll0289 n=1 Tax=Gloeobacter violaceus (strain ATCC 29082 / PCC 7421) TaxID=251221 RepID=Y289_GLOVI|nr:ABC transporter ATP-binding protein [Gloeobacter violaceus]Q7NNW9.1 RecName: Full=Putative ABC transporter ATP-binding protein gll0289 [Gloeobacter violaceus PCC 7421]BAC88230.1 cobalt ABC transporter ATP binding protein [Gloeobacter violaceus PCC 7421]
MIEPLVVEELHYSYPDGTAALRGITLALGTGENVALVGPNGSGKSTLLLHLNGLLLPGRGRIEVGGKPLSASTLEFARRFVGLLFQNPEDQLFMPTVGEDVAFGPQNLGRKGEKLRECVRTALERVGLEPARFLERQSYNLSIGEKKRVALAGVLAMEPEVLVLDEPSAGLDPRSRRRLIRLLTELPQTKLVATHDLDMALETCTRTIIIDRGQVVADGPSDQILADRVLLETHGLELPLSLGR